MSRLLYQAELPRRAPNRNRTDDLFLTMETLYRLSYGGEKTWASVQPAAAPREIEGIPSAYRA